METMVLKVVRPTIGLVVEVVVLVVKVLEEEEL